MIVSLQQVGGDQVVLKRVHLSIPAGHDLSGLTFVIRSADSTAWWRDGELNFKYPLGSQISAAEMMSS